MEKQPAVVFFFFYAYAPLFPFSSLCCDSRSQSSGRLSDMLLMAAFGGQLGDRGSTENLSADRAIDIAG